MRAFVIAAMFGGAMLVAGCGSDGGGSGSSDRPEPTGTATEFTIRVEDGSPIGGPKTIKVSQGERVTVTVKPDGKLRAHLHGYDILEEGSKGEAAVIDFMAEDAGVFELENEDDGELLANVAVYPK